jgi:hypothetical protein
VTQGLDAGAYLGGSVSVIVAVALLAWGAWRLRGALLPEWSGPPARLAEAVMGIAAAIATAQILGTFGQFRRFPILVGCVAAGLAMGIIGGRIAPRRSSPPVASEARSRREEVVAVVVAGAVVAAQWATHVADAYDKGMTHVDTLWYHAPYAAHFLQEGNLTDLPSRSDVLQTYYPLNSSLVHALVYLPFDTDVLSPLVNIGWTVLALLAAWCIGRRWGVAPLCLLGAVTVFSLPMLAGTQPGQASNDVASAGLLLAAVALLLEVWFAPVPTTLAGVAVGLALGSKLTLIVPVLVLTLGIVIVAVRAQRIASAIGYCVAVAIFGSYWYVRNWAVAGNPLPWFEVDVGPLSLSRRVVDEGDTIADHFRDGEWWSSVAFPGFSQALGRAWPYVLVFAVITVVVIVTDRSDVERIVGVALAATAVGYIFTPQSGGLNFAFNVRYLTPLLLVGFVLVPLSLSGRAVLWRRVTVLLMVGLIALNLATAQEERTPTWPSGKVPLAILAGVGVIGAVAAFMWLQRRRDPARSFGLAGIVLVGTTLVIGWPLQRSYLEERYVDAGLPFDPIAGYFRQVRDSDVVVFGTVEVYPMLGPDFSNRVTVGQGPTTRLRADPCRQWRDVLDGRYRYVVVAPHYLYPVRPPEAWFASDPGTTAVVSEGNNVVYRLNGSLHPDECQASTSLPARG